jgi:L-lactate dehydrogenase complex protein LldG
MNRSERTTQFTQKARAVSATVKTVATMDDALAHAVDVCAQKQACAILASGCEHALSDPAEELCGLKQWEKLIAAPNLKDRDAQSLTSLCRPAGIGLIQRGLAAYAGGIDVGLTLADFAISETGTLVINCPDEDLRLATMISEVHVAVLNAGDIYSDSYDIADKLAGFFAKSDYTAFITGASRTADIERVLTLGVHGPLDLHVLIIDGQSSL